VNKDARKLDMLAFQISF